MLGENWVTLISQVFNLPFQGIVDFLANAKTTVSITPPGKLTQSVV